MLRARTAATAVPSASMTASRSWTRLPGRNSDVVTVRGASGTGRSSSTVTRTTWSPLSPASRSMAQAPSAATGPPWRALGAQGPRDRAVGTKNWPSGTKKASPSRAASDKAWWEICSCTSDDATVPGDRVAMRHPGHEGTLAAPHTHTDTKGSHGIGTGSDRHQAVAGRGMGDYRRFWRHRRLDAGHRVLSGGGREPD